MSDSRSTSTRRRALKYAGVTGLSGVAGLTGLSLTSQPALALSGSVQLPTGLAEGSVTVPSYEIQYAELDTTSDITINYVLRTDAGTKTTESHVVSITEPTGVVMTGDHSISIPSGDVSLEVQLEHPSVGTVSTQESSATTVSSDLPSVIDNFEKASYEDQNATLSDYYDGDLSQFNRQTSVVSEGSYALEGYTNTDETDYGISSTSGLNSYPQAGDKFSYWFRMSNIRSSDSGGLRTQTMFATQSSVSQPDCYYVYTSGTDWGGPGWALGKLENGSVNYLFKDGYAWENDTWYRAVVDWGSDGSFTVTLYDAAGNQLRQNTGSDSTYTSGGAGFDVSIDTNITSEAWMYWDDLKLIK